MLGFIIVLVIFLSVLLILLLFLMLAGNSIKTEQLIHALTILADLSQIGEEIDFKIEGISRVTLFVDKSLELFEQELYDEWIFFFFDEILKNEDYELLEELKIS